MNMNELAQELCGMERGAKEVSIAQMKEILRCLALMIIDDPLEIIGLLVKYAKKVEPRD